MALRGWPVVERPLQDVLERDRFIGKPSPGRSPSDRQGPARGAMARGAGIAVGGYVLPGVVRHVRS
jgi:hypothetical protein